MEKGKITKVAEWKTGKGRFVGIDGVDYVALAPIGAKVGDVVEYSLSKKFVYGKQVLDKLLPPLEHFEARDEDRAKPTPIAVVSFRSHDVPKPDAREEYSQAQGDAVKRAENVRLECLACACDFASNPSIKEGTNIEGIVATAKRFEKYAKEGI
jgi:hypothetical protein